MSTARRDGKTVAPLVKNVYVECALENQPEKTPDKKPDSAFLRSTWFIVILAIVTLVLGLIPLANKLLLPFRFFTTLVHEGGHAIAALLLGGDVQQIVVNPDASGYTRFTAPDTRLIRGIVATSGYMGTSLFGGLLIVLATFDKLAKPLLFLLGAMIGLAVLLYFRDVFTVLLCAGFAVVLLWIAVKGGVNLNYFVVNVLAVQCGLNAMGDVIGLAMISAGAPKSAYSLNVSDADVMSELFLLPAMVWSILWIVLSIVILYYGLKFSASIRANRNKIAG